ncbi:MAG: cAMP-dependent protein kinase type II-beta regulatory subunit [Paramarteilia canceri]
MQKKVVKKNEVIIREGDLGDYFYVIKKGNFKIERYNENKSEIEELCQLSDSGFFGELALLYNERRQATVTALTDGILWQIDRKNFKNIVCGHENYLRQNKINHLRNIPLFSKFSNNDIDKLSDALVSEIIEIPNYTIIEQGGPADCLYLIVKGEIQFEKTENDKKKIVGKASSGDYFGEIALINHCKRSATAKSLGKCELYKLSSNDFYRLIGPCLEMLKQGMGKYAM